MAGSLGEHRHRIAVVRRLADREELSAARERLPILYVDAVPVRVDDLGEVTAIGLLLRARREAR